MSSPRFFGRLAIIAGALALSLPAFAGTLSPQLRALADSYHKTPQTTVAHLAQATAAAAPRSRLFAPHVNGAGLVQVYLHYGPGEAPSRAALDLLGAQEVLVSRPLGVVQAWVPIAKLRAAAALGGVTTVGLPAYAYVKGPAGAVPATDVCSGVQSGIAIDNEGIAAENVGPVHAQGVEGAGVKVGIISTGVDCIADSKAQGYLPTDVFVDPTLSGDGDEGTAMLEEVHAMAPDAMLGFCGFESDGNFTTADFLQCLSDLTTWGANVISDDLGFGEPFIFNNTNGDNFLTAISNFATTHPLITLTTSAGNDAQDYFQHAYIADATPNIISLSPSYTAGQGQVGGRSYHSAMNFGVAVGSAADATEPVIILPTSVAPEVELQAVLTWNDPAAGPFDDLDLFLVQNDGTVVASSTFDQTTGPNPNIGDGEFIAYQNTTGKNQTLFLAALCFQCDHPILIKLTGLLNGGGAFKYVTNGGVSGHAGLAAEFTAGAAQWSGQGVTSTIEDFSDTGPYTFGDWSSGVKTRQKPDAIGTDGVTVSGAGGFGVPQSLGHLFFGTSAASPNIGAVVALLRGFAPNAATSAAGWKQIVMNTANPSALTNYSVNAGGAGLVDAAAAVSSLNPSSITATITSPATSPFKVDPNTDIPFAATCDFQGNETPQYNWSFGESGSNAPPDATGLAPAGVQYANGGIYTVTFTCTVGNGSDSASVTAEVQAAATAEDQSLETAHNKPLTGQLKGTGTGGEQLSAVIVANPSHGKLTVDQDQFTYTPNKGFSGNDSFQFQIDNGVEKSNTATVTIAVAAGSPPVASDGTLSTQENTAASGTLSATDPDGDPLTFSIVTQPSNGTLSLTSASAGTYTYTPSTDFVGSDSFTFKANDGTGDSNVATVSITVAAAPPPSGGGGGAFGGLGLGLLVALGGLAFLVRRRR